MERLNLHILLELEHQYDVHLVGPTGAEAFVPQANRVSACSHKPIYRFLTQATVATIRAAKRIRPKFILAGSGVNALPAWVAARLVGAKFSVYLHGLDIVVDNFWYRHFFLPVIRRADFWLVNSQSTASLAVAAGLDEQRIHVLYPGVEIPEQLPSEEAGQAWRNSHGLGSMPLMLSVGRLTKRKGLTEFIRNSLPAILHEIPQALLVVIGEEPNAALSAGSAKHTLATAIQETGTEEHIRFLGKVNDDELTLAYTSANVLVFPVLDLPGDVEGFGMVAIEAAAHGTPTAAFEVGGVPDAVSPGISGALAMPGDYAGLSRQISAYLRTGKTNRVIESCQRFAEAFSWEKFGARLRNIIDLQMGQ